MRPGDPCDVYADSRLVIRGTIAARVTWFDASQHGYTLHIEQKCPLWFWALQSDTAIYLA